MVSTQDFNDLQSIVSRLREDLEKLTGVFGAEKQTFMDALQVSHADQQNKLFGVVNDARAEFEQLRAAGADLHEKTASSVNDLYNKVGELQRGAGSGGGGRKETGYIPQKMAVPKPFSDKMEDWRMWQEEVEDYMDSINPGVKKLLQAINIEKADIDEDWKLLHTGDFDPKVLGDEVNIYRALKILTAGEAKKVVTNVKDENGLMAWQRLRFRFEPTLTAKQGMVLAEFSGMVAKPAKAPGDLVGLMTEMDKKVKLIEDLTSEAVSDMHKKSVLIGILDQLTRQHTAMHHAATYDQIRKVVAEFACNAMVATQGDAMQVGAVTEKNIANEHEKKDEEWDWNDEHSALALGQSVKCYNCGGLGHLSRNCSSARKSKGEGKGNEKGGGMTEKGQPKGGYGKSAGKGGKGVSPSFTGCWTCGGRHRQADCPGNGANRGKGGKGNGKGGFRSLEEVSSNDWHGHSQEERIGRLSCIKECCEAGPKVGNKMVDMKAEQIDETIQQSGAEGGEDWTTVMSKKNKNIANKKQMMGERSNTFVQLSCVKDCCNTDSPKITNKKAGMQASLIKARTCRPSHVDMQAMLERIQRPAQDVCEEWQADTSKNNWTFANINAKEQQAEKGLNMVLTIEPEGLNPITENNGWQEIELAVDSGATETVMGEDMLDFIDVKEGLASKRGVEYEVANGHKIPNLGEKKFVGTSDEGMTRHITAQVCDVNKALLSVKRMMAAGNRVVFDAEGSYIEDKSTKEKMWMREDKGLFMLKLWVKKGF